MDYFTLEPLQARHGDCLLLHFGSSDAAGTILIDGGPAQVYATSLKPRLTALAKKRPGGPFSIDLMMVSHIDDDHIQGILDFTEEWVEAKSDHRPWPWPVKQLWHNSFERIAGADPHQVQTSLLASFGTDSVGAIGDLGSDDHDEASTYKVLASVGQGFRLRNDAQVVHLATNTGFGGLVRPDAAINPLPLGPDLNLHVIGPLPKQLAALQKLFAKELPKGPAASLAAYTDTTIPNLSSIVVLAAYKGKTMLLTGDARGDYILQGLKDAGLLAGDTLHVDILKMQHHGSDRNTAGAFFEKVTADHYVASADGQYENPDRATFEMLTVARSKADRYTIHLTYEIDAIDALRQRERETAIASAVKKHKPAPRDWADEVDSLAVFFARCATDGYAFTVVTPATAKAGIDLLDPITF